MERPLDKFQFHPSEWGFFWQTWTGVDNNRYCSVCFGCITIAFPIKKETKC